ncbi:MAG: tyrosine--tRNA ligase [Acidobacteriota bacterium]
MGNISKNFVEELKWRGMIHDIMPGTEEFLMKESTSAYVGIDPTADSLHIGHLVSVMILKHFQMCGHKPIALLGGATGMIGDPSGRSDERNLLSEETLRENQDGIKKQLSKFLDFSAEKPNSAELVNNYDWMKDYSFLRFIREVGKHITVNYMMSKDSVKKRIGEDSKTGMSFTEFSYQLVQATDFLELYRTKNCHLQMGGSDQWGNITTGTELIRRIENGEAYALTCPLITKSDGSKFGKTEGGNIWIDPSRTSPYKFYQFWLNTSDDDAEKYIKIFTLLGKEEIEKLSEEHKLAPHLRLLQKRLAEEVTTFVHSEEDLRTSEEASRILFGKGTKETLLNISESDFLSIFEGVPAFDIKKSDLDKGINILDLLAVHTTVFSSKGEARRMIKGGGVSINKDKIDDPEKMIGKTDVLNNQYILAQAGKKKYSLITLK